jgi:hypothetical protein
MKPRYRYLYIVIILLIFIPFQVYADDYLNRREIKGILYSTISLIAFIYSVIFVRSIKKRKKEALDIISISSTNDITWNLNNINNFFTKIMSLYFKAYLLRRPKLLSKYLTKEYYQYNYELINYAIISKHKYFYDDLKLVKHELVQTSDYLDDNKDSFSIYTNISYCKYVIDETTKELISGKQDEHIDSRELWHFVRVKNKWLLSNIEGNVGILDVSELKSYIERKKEV